MTLDLIASGARRANRPHDGVTDTWKAAIGTSCREELVVELAEKSIDADSPSGALWSGKLTSADARVRHTSSTELVSASPDSGPRIERADGETTGSRRFTEPAPANLQIDVRKGVYDFDITGAFQLALTARARTETREADGSVNRSAGSGEVPALVGKSISPALAFPLYLGPVAPDSSAIPKDVAAAQALAQQLQTLRFKLPPSGMVLRGETTVPMRLVLPKAPWDQNDSTEACKWVMRWSFTPEKARLTMEPVSVAEYQRWLPAPTDQANLYPDGKPLDFRAKFEAATGGTAPTGRIRFILRDLSEHPGICQNDPPFGTPDNKPDIRFAVDQGQGIRRLSDTQCETDGDVKEATVRVEATDTGGFAHLAVESPNLGLQGQWKGKMDLSIPLDDNDNEIADAWDERSSDKSRNADDEPRDGQASEGDGLPLSDEYRGFVLWENGSKVFKRTNPKEKDFFVLVEDGEVGRNKEVDLDLFRTYSRLVGHEVRTPNVGIDTSLKGARRLDFNDDGGSTRLTYSLRIKFTPYGPAGLRDPNLTNAPANQLDPNARAYLAGAGAGGEATPLGADLIMVFRARIQNVADFFFNILETALISPNTPYPQNGATLGSRLTQLPPSVRANAQAAVDRWKANRDVVTRNLAEDTVRMSVLHEMLHACGVNHHEPTTEGEETHCLIRYFSVAQEWEICINSATIPGWKQHGHNYTQVCRGRESKCWEGITTTP